MCLSLAQSPDSSVAFIPWSTVLIVPCHSHLGFHQLLLKKGANALALVQSWLCRIPKLFDAPILNNRDNSCKQSFTRRPALEFVNLLHYNIRSILPFLINVFFFEHYEPNDRHYCIVTSVSGGKNNPLFSTQFPKYPETRNFIKLARNGQECCMFIWYFSLIKRSLLILLIGGYFRSFLFLPLYPTRESKL